MHILLIVQFIPEFNQKIFMNSVNVDMNFVLKSIAYKKLNERIRRNKNLLDILQKFTKKINFKCTMNFENSY